MKRKRNIAIKAQEVQRKEDMISLLDKVLDYARLRPLILPYASLKIKKFEHNSLNDLVDFCFCGIGGLIKPLQVKGEILEILRILDRMKLKTVVEIGTAKGGTLFLFSRTASKDATMISVDLPKGMFGGGYHKWKIPLYKNFASANQQIHLIREDSHSKATLGKVRMILDSKKVDFLFIDGDHTYDGVKRDFELYSPLVGEGIIAFHDIAIHPPETGCEVSKFWDEIKKKHEYIEIIENRDQGWGGIGLLIIKPTR